MFETWCDVWDGGDHGDAVGPVLVAVMAVMLTVARVEHPSVKDAMVAAVVASTVPCSTLMARGAPYGCAWPDGTWGTRMSIVDCAPMRASRDATRTVGGSDDGRWCDGGPCHQVLTAVDGETSSDGHTSQSHCVMRGEIVTDWWRSVLVVCHFCCAILCGHKVRRWWMMRTSWPMMLMSQRLEFPAMHNATFPRTSSRPTANKCCQLF